MNTICKIALTIVVSTFGVDASENYFTNGYYDNLPTFFHSCWFYGGITEDMMEKYELEKFNMVLIEKGEGVFRNTSVEYYSDGTCKSFEPVQKNTEDYTEDRMVRFCKMYKQKYGMDRTCFIYYNAMLSWIWYKLNDDYTALKASDSNIIAWSRNGDDTFPDSQNIPVFDLRDNVPQVKEFFINAIESVVKHPDNAPYIDGIFVDRGFIKKALQAELTTAPGRLTLKADRYFQPYSRGKRDFLNELENRGIKTLVNPGAFYYSHVKSDFLGYGTLDEIYGFEHYMQNTSIIHLERCCIDSDTLYKIKKANDAGKDVQCHGGMIGKLTCGFYECREYLRSFLATFLFGIEPTGKGFFACHKFWSLNQDVGDCRDEINPAWVRNDYFRPMEYDMPLGEPQERVDENFNPVQVTDNAFTQLSYRAFLNRESRALQAIAVWSGNPKTTTVCYVNDCVKNLDIRNGKKCFGNIPEICDPLITKFQSKYTLAPTIPPNEREPTSRPTVPGETPAPTSVDPTLGAGNGISGGAVAGAVVTPLIILPFSVAGYYYRDRIGVQLKKMSKFFTRDKRQGSTGYRRP